MAFEGAFFLDVFLRKLEFFFCNVFLARGFWKYGWLLILVSREWEPFSHCVYLRKCGSSFGLGLWYCKEASFHYSSKKKKKKKKKKRRVGAWDEERSESWTCSDHRASPGSQTALPLAAPANPAAREHAGWVKDASVWGGSLHRLQPYPWVSFHVVCELGMVFAGEYLQPIWWLGTRTLNFN